MDVKPLYDPHESGKFPVSRAKGGIFQVCPAIFSNLPVDKGQGFVLTPAPPVASHRSAARILRQLPPPSAHPPAPSPRR